MTEKFVVTTCFLFVFNFFMLLNCDVLMLSCSDVNKDLGPKANDLDFGLKDQDEGLTSLLS